MPYINQAMRDQLDAMRLKTITCLNAGELNYCFTVLVKEYLAHHGTSYRHLNDCIGALEGAKLELYRRTVAPYEDEKIEENGDV